MVGPSPHDKFGDFFEDLDIQKSLDRLLQYLAVETKAQNVVWFLADEWDRTTHLIKAKKSLEPDQDLYSSVRKRALREVSEESLIEVQKLFLNSGLSAEVKATKALTHAYFPILRTKSKENLGYLLVLGLDPLSANKTAERISKDLLELSKHLGFCIDYWRALSLSFLDDLTGLYNQKYLSMVVENEIHRASRSQDKFSVLFMDIDYFKSVNDENGHWVGSKVLIELSRMILSDVRRSDYAFRYGGDEFVVVLPETDAKGALRVAERLRKSISSTEFIVDGLRLKVTVSIGLATYPDHARSYKEIIKMADEAMYCGKNKSRNIVYIAG